MTAPHLPCSLPAPARLGRAHRLARRALRERLLGLEHVGVSVRDESGRERWGRGERTVHVDVRDPRFYLRTLAGGTMGAAESWMRGEWECDDLAALVQALLLDRERLDAIGGVATGILDFGRRVLHAARRNTRPGSRRNIAAHYDLGNDFFALFLDPSLTYSCGIFEHEGASLEEASAAKYERLARKLDLRPSDHVLEIGCGWGGFAIHAAERFGCRVTATTISREQWEWARERVAARGLGERVEILLEDYRELRGRFDKVASIEMIEAVGHQYLETFFRVAEQRLRADGLLALQAITIADREYERALRTVDFIKRYVFPGGFLPSVTALAAAATRASDLRMVHLEDITPHYAETLRHWARRFRGHRARLAARGYPERLLRMWEFYMAYCEGGFEARHIGTVQLLLARPAARRAPVLGGLR